MQILSYLVYSTLCLSESLNYPPPLIILYYLLFQCIVSCDTIGPCNTRSNAALSQCTMSYIHHNYMLMHVQPIIKVRHTSSGQSFLESLIPHHFYALHQLTIVHALSMFYVICHLLISTIGYTSIIHAIHLFNQQGPFLCPCHTPHHIYIYIYIYI